MPKLKDEQLQDALKQHLQEDENLLHWAFGVKQPNIFLIIGLLALFILPGIIAVQMLTKNFIVGLTNKRLIVLRVISITNANIKDKIEYNLNELKSMNVITSTGSIFTKIKIEDPVKPFAAKFHRAFSKDNREHSIAIAESVKS